MLSSLALSSFPADGASAPYFLPTTKEKKKKPKKKKKQLKKKQLKKKTGRKQKTERQPWLLTVMYVDVSPLYCR